MDIAKYAGLFFLRSEYVYLPGLGNLEIKKIKSSYNHDLGAIEPTRGEIMFKPAIGVIDDEFANFVANNERVSIASAANAITNFGKRVKAEIGEGSRVEIPGIGTFVKNGDTIGFEVASTFEYKPKSIPVFKNVSNTEEYTGQKDIQDIIENTHFKNLSADEEVELEKPKVNYGKLVMLIVLAVLVLGGVGYFAYYIINNNDNVEQTASSNNDIDETTLPQEATPVPTQDTNSVASNDANTTAVVSADGTLPIIVNEYTAKESADARVKKLQSYGWQVCTETKDNATFYVVVKAQANPAGEQTTVDSIKRLLNPKFDVRLYK